MPLRGTNIDTDRIIPARFLKAITFEGLEDHLFEDDRLQAASQPGGPHPLSAPAYAAASILLVTANFGCGSSREHAPQAIRRKGFRAIIGESFSEIFFGNSVALGLPCLTAATPDVERLLDATEANPSLVLEIDLEHMTVRVGDHTSPVALPAGARASFLNGTWDATALLLERFEEIEAVARRLPYVNGFQRT